VHKNLRRWLFFYIIQIIINLEKLRSLKNHPYFIAEKYEKEGKINKAIQIYWELINNNEMGRHPYDRLRIIYAKQKDWDNAIKICQKFIDSIKSGNDQFLHPSFKIIMKKYKEWIRKYEKKLGKNTIYDFHSSNWILTQSIINSSKNVKKPSSKPPPVFHLNDILPEWARDEISFISIDAPSLISRYPSLEIMSNSNRLYFEKWINHWKNGRPLDIKDYISYLFIYVYNILENSLPRIPAHIVKRKEKNSIRNKINNNDIRELLLLQHVYKNEKIFCNYLLTWIFDAYIYNYDYLNAVTYIEYQRNNNGLHLKYTDSNYMILNIKYNNRISMSGEDIVQLSNRKWNEIISENEEHIIKYLDIKIKNFEEENHIDLLSLITEQYAAFISSYNYSAFRDTPKSLNVLEITDYYDYSELSDFNRVISDWMKDAENIVREIMGLPRIGEGWISETTLYNRICKIFKDERYEILFHAHPSFLKGLELDIFIPTLKLGIEYQGKQHYEPIDFFGGLQGFKEQRKRDNLKKFLCEQHGISVVYFKYDDSIEDGDIINKIKTMV